MKDRKDGPDMDLLPCQRAMLESRKDIRGWSWYRCERSEFLLSGPGLSLLEMACEKCEHRRAEKDGNTPP